VFVAIVIRCPNPSGVPSREMNLMNPAGGRRVEIVAGWRHFQVVEVEHVAEAVVHERVGVAPVGRLRGIGAAEVDLRGEARREQGEQHETADGLSVKQGDAGMKLAEIHNFVKFLVMNAVNLFARTLQK